MKTENQKNESESTQITFKLTPDERKKIEKDAEELGFSVSEYIRIKCTMVENDFLKLKNQFAEVEKENKSLKVRLLFYKNTERDEHSIVLQLTKEQQEILDELFYDYEDQTESLAWNIVSFILEVLRNENIVRDYLKGKEVPEEEILKVFCGIEKKEDTEST